MRCVTEVAGKLRRSRCIEAELMAKLGALGFRYRLAHDLAQRIAERSLHGKGDYRDGQHDQNGFRRPLPDEGQRCAKRL